MRNFSRDLIKQFLILILFIAPKFPLYYFKTRKIAPDGQYYHIKGFSGPNLENVNGALAEQNLDESKPSPPTEDKQVGSLV